MNYFRLLWNLYRQKRNAGRRKEQIERLQKKKLEKLLLFAYEYSPYYRKVFEAKGIFPENIRRTPLENFPVLDKGILMEHFDELVTDRSLKQEELLRFDEASEDGGEIYLDKYHVIHSSGSTGTPRYFVYDNAAWEQMLIGIIRGALWGMSMGSVLKLLAEKPRILYIAATDGRYGGAMAVGDGIRGIRAEQRFLDINTPLAKWREVVLEFHPNIIIGYPSAVKILAEQTGGENETLHVRRIISCGEPLSIGLRKFLENAFDTEVVNFYGASESLALGVEQRADEGMILFDDLNVIEVIDGEMYVTCLYNFTQPLIRYHISDKLVLHETEDDADCFFTKADVLLCRNEDVLWFEKPDGSKEYLHPLSMEGFCVVGLLDYQFYQTSPISFEMLAEAEESADRANVTEEIYRHVRKLLSDKDLEEIQFSIRFVEQIIPDKHTGKKPLIIKMMEDKEDDKNKHYREAI
ncbi:MAG: phenylacetate--CoA ligase family protein [Lachnospiraceae bacterium]|nr:phenylacetate--CoA ligase family protein [Lachnospiraceae bacterium]